MPNSRRRKIPLNGSSKTKTPPTSHERHSGGRGNGSGRKGWARWGCKPDMSEVESRMAELEAKLKRTSEENIKLLRQENEAARERERQRKAAEEAARKEKEEETNPEKAQTVETEEIAKEEKSAMEGLSPEEAKVQKRKILEERWERLKQLMDPKEMAKYREAFRLFDTDGSGSGN